MVKKRFEKRKGTYIMRSKQSEEFVWDSGKESTSFSRD